MRKVIDAKQTLFISYCWSDGTPYADELEKQLSVDFSVKRDRTQLGCNDDIDAYMRKIVVGLRVGVGFGVPDGLTVYILTSSNN